MYYSVFNLETGNYMATGLNSTTEAEAVEAIFDYLYADMEDEDKDIADNFSSDEKRKYVCGFVFRIDEHEQLLEEAE
jgi:hypothetical protein